MTAVVPRAAAPSAASRQAHTVGPQRPRGPETHTAATAFGAFATVGGATALTPLIAGTTYLIPIAEVVAIVWLVGVGSRLSRIPVAVTSLVQIVVLVASITGLQLTTGVGGVLPGPAAVREAGAMLSTAWNDIMTTVPPAALTEELSLFVTLAIGTLALVIDQLIAATRTPALVALPLLGLYSVPAAISTAMLPWYAFALPAACYAGILAADRPRTAGRSAALAAVTGTVVAALSLAAALTLPNAATGIGTQGRLPRTHGASTDLGISPWALLRGDLTDSNPVDIARLDNVEKPAYLRTFALEKWQPGEGFGLGPISADTKNVTGTLSHAPGVGADAGAGHTVTITPQHYRDQYLPIYLDTTSVTGIGPGWDYDADLHTVFRGSPTTPGVYTVTAASDVASIEQLRKDSIQASPSLADTGDLPAEVSTLAERLTADAATSFDKVNALLEFFTDPANGFTYSLSTPPGNSGDALVDFLDSRTGYCEQYAAAMAILVRSLGIPARVGIGFTQGTQQGDGRFEVTSHNAHAWVEVPFDSAGWVIFDPTPGVNGQGGLQGFSDVPGADETADETPASTTTTTGTTAATTSASTAPGELVPTADRAQSPTGQAASDGARGIAAAAAVVMAVLLALAFVATPRLLRSRRRRRRLASARTGGSGSVSAAWGEIVDTARDHGVEFNAHGSARDIASAIAQRAHLSTGARRDLEQVVIAAEEAWYGTPNDAQPPRVLSAGVLGVITGLRHEYPLSGRSLWWPRSLRRSR